MDSLPRSSQELDAKHCQQEVATLERLIEEQAKVMSALQQKKDVALLCLRAAARLQGICWKCLLARVTVAAGKFLALRHDQLFNSLPAQ